MLQDLPRRKRLLLLRRDMDLSLLVAEGVLEGMLLVQEMRVEALKVHQGTLRVEGVDGMR